MSAPEARHAEPGAEGWGPAEDLLELLRERGQTLGVAESCTGGLLEARITAVPGASDVFWGGVVAYHDHAKLDLLGVEPELLARHGAVSEEVGRRMAEGIRARLGTVWGVAVTGIAGPGGGSPEKPVGTVWIAVEGPVRSATCFLFLGDRAAVRREAVRAALSLALDAAARVSR